MKQKLLLTSLLTVLLVSGCSPKTNKFSIRNEDQKAFLESGNPALILTYGNGKTEKSKPAPVVISSKLEGACKFEIFTDKELKNKVRTIDSDSNSVEVYNLLLGQEYYCNISNGTSTEMWKGVINDSFYRPIFIDGLTNVRDIGAYRTTNKSNINQGLIYRSSKLNADESSTPLITELGKKQFVEELGLKAELDLRQYDNNESGQISTSPAGESVKYYIVPMKSGGSYMTVNNSVYKDIFKILGNRQNYPIDLHCSIGTDRTGALCLLLESLLNVQEQDILFDYVFSNFGNIGGSRTVKTAQDNLNIINSKSGATLSERAKTYLINDCLVDETDINNFIKIMTE